MLLAVAQYYGTAHCILILLVDTCRLTESLNTDMVKSENPEAVVATEPQGKHIFTASLLYSSLYSTYTFYTFPVSWKCLQWSIHTYIHSTLSVHTYSSWWS